MQSNTKLNDYQKIQHALMWDRVSNKGGFVYCSKGLGITIAAMPAFKGSDTMRVSVSRASGNEKKIRRKVGEFVALYNLLEVDKYITIQNQHFGNADDFINWVCDYFIPGIA